MAKKQSGGRLQTTWDLTPMYKGDNDPKIAQNLKEVTEQVQKFATKWQKKTDDSQRSSSYLTDPKVLKLALDEYQNLLSHYGHDGAAGYYFSLRESLDEANPTIKAKTNQTREVMVKNVNAIQFFELNLAKIEAKNQEKFLKAPELKLYQHFLEQIFAYSKHVLSDSEEKIINLKSQPAYENWVKMTSQFLSSETAETLDEDGKQKNKNFSEILTLLNSEKKRVRDSANDAFNKILEKNLAVATEEINSILADKKIDDDLRGFTRADEGTLLSDDVDTQTIDTLLKAVSERFDLSARFYKLKAKLFKVKKLGYHERNIEYGKIKNNYTLPQAVSLVNTVMERLDPEFSEIFNRLFNNGQVDVYPKKGKRHGAFCAHQRYRLDLPTYVLLNYGENFKEVVTIAHEFGHAINNELIREKQPAIYFSTPTSTAEVASVFMEDFVIEEILKGANDEEKLAILMSRLNEQASACFRQVGCYLFEKELHEEFRKKGYLSSAEIGQIFQKNMRAYMGPAVDQPKWAQNWWVYWNHIRYYFYVYSYAGGQLIGMALQNQVRKDPKNIEGVKQFLASGTSKAPKQIFAELGIDITKKAFWNQGLEEFENSLKETEKLAKKLGKI
jgi:oligoendopeptidase F